MQIDDSYVTRATSAAVLDRIERIATPRYRMVDTHCLVLLCAVVPPLSFLRLQVPGSRESQLQRDAAAARARRGVLRGAMVKVIQPRNTGANHGKSQTMEIQFRIGPDGVKPERIIPQTRFHH